MDGSILPGFYGIEAGQSAVGDIFLWFVNHLVPERYGRTTDEKFKTLGALAAKQKPGEHGLLALDWNNGNRTILVDVRLSGLLLGQTLHTEAHEIYRALIEATAFGALTIAKRIEEYGVPVKEFVNCGGLAAKNPLLMQIYADVTGRPMKVSRSDQTCALGAAIFGAVAAGKEASGFAQRARGAARRLRREGQVLSPEPEGAGGLRRTLPALPRAARRLRHARVVGPARSRDEGPHPHPRTATELRSTAGDNGDGRREDEHERRFMLDHSSLVILRSW